MIHLFPLSYLGATAFRIPHGTGRSTPKTGVPQKLRSYINGNILKQTFFNEKNIFLQCLLILSTKKKY